jgi:hypothetical protein
LIVQANYLAFLEQLILRARLVGKRDASIPLYFFGTAARTGIASVHFPDATDSAIVSFSGQTIALRMDDWGRIISGQLGPTRVSRVRFGEFLPTDSTVVVACGAATQEARHALSDPALTRVFARYDVRPVDVANARALRDASDVAVCHQMLELFQVRGQASGSDQSLFQVGEVYVAVAGAHPSHGGAAVIYADNLEVAHLIPLGTQH